MTYDEIKRLVAGCEVTTGSSDSLALTFTIASDAFTQRGIDVDSGVKQRIVSLVLRALEHYREAHPHTLGQIEDAAIRALLWGES